MKRNLAVGVLFLLVIGANAQRKTEFGVTIGAGAIFHKGAVDEFAPEKGYTFNFGLFISQPVFKKQFIETGLHYNFENLELDSYYFDPDNNYNLPLNSVEVPLAFGWELSSKFNVKAGVSALWLIDKGIVKNEVGFDWHLGLAYNLNWVELSLKYQQGFSNSEFWYFYVETKRLEIVYKRRVVKLEVNIPISNFLRK